MTIVADYSAGFPGAKALKKAGFIGAVRYIGSPGNPKCATAEELQDFDAEGLGMGLVFEQTSGQWRNGYSQGQHDARVARDHALAIGFPLGRSDRPIYFAIDEDVVTSDEYEAMDAYADGWASILGHEGCGPYGEYDVVLRCWSRGFKWAWQCRAWSGTPVKYFELRQLFQRVGTVLVNGIPCDINEVNAADWGQHNGGITMDWNDIAREIGEGDAKRGVSYGEMLRSMDDNTGRTRDGIDEVKEAVAELKTTGVPVDLQLSEADREDIANRVADKLAARLKD